MDTMDKILLTVSGLCCAPAVLLLALWVGACMADNWDAPEYPYTGFCPDYPTLQE